MIRKLITLLIIAILIIAWIYLRAIGFLGNWETVILFLLSIILPYLISYCFQLSQPGVILKIKNVRLNKKQVSNDLGYYLTATVLNKSKKIALNIDARFDIKDDSGKPPPLMYVKTVETNGEKSVSTEIKPFDEKLEHGWVKDGEYYGKILNQLRYGDEFILLFPYDKRAIIRGTSLFSPEIPRHYSSTETEYLLKLESNKKYEVKINVRGEDSERNTVEATKKVKMKVKSHDSQ